MCRDGGGITEIGAVKVRGGEVLGEFGTLVTRAAHPGVHHGADRHHRVHADAAPPIDQVLPAFLEFRGRPGWWRTTRPTTPGFLKAACARQGYPWPKPLVLDTAALARRALVADEVPNHRLSTLARHFQSATEPRPPRPRGRPGDR